MQTDTGRRPSANPEGSLRAVHLPPVRAGFCTRAESHPAPAGSRLEVSMVMSIVPAIDILSGLRDSLGKSRRTCQGSHRRFDFPARAEILQFWQEFARLREAREKTAVRALSVVVGHYRQQPVGCPHLGPYTKTLPLSRRCRARPAYQNGFDSMACGRGQRREGPGLRQADMRPTAEKFSYVQRAGLTSPAFRPASKRLGYVWTWNNSY